MTASLRYQVTTLAFALTLPAIGHAQDAARAQEPAETFELTVANIMRGPELVGSPPWGGGGGPPRRLDLLPLEAGRAALERGDLALPRCRPRRRARAPER